MAPPPTVPHPPSNLGQQVGALYDDHHDWLRRWLGQKLGDSHQAADLAQDTFTRLLAREDTLSLQEPRAFLTVIARRLLANHWRRWRVEQAYLQALAALPPATAPSPEERAIVLEALVALDRMLDGLPVMVKRAFLLTHLDELTHQQAATALGISVSTVQRHIATAAMRCYFTVER